ncbi:hypothetical protein [uncultured Desulfovibrio sp.]|uniref:hypothetical protein n=1 Tax=uncultured Desulfovibrio sp. TaxID=167968 RepID=UPI0028041D4D|nr:hypothetical protein [uncultured Desulfovibrio sp.]
MSIKEQEGNDTSFPYLNEILEFAEKVKNKEHREQAGDRLYASTTANVVSKIYDEIYRVKKIKKDFSPVDIDRYTLEQAMRPFCALANILIQAGDSAQEVDAGDVGNVLGALICYAHKKTNGYPNIGDIY